MSAEPATPWLGANDETPIFDALMNEHVHSAAEAPMAVFQVHMQEQELEIRDLKETIRLAATYL